MKNFVIRQQVWIIKLLKSSYPILCTCSSGTYRTVHDSTYTCMFTMQIEMIVLVCLGEHNEVVHFEPYVDPAAAPRHAALPKHNHPPIELFFFLKVHS